MNSSSATLTLLWSVPSSATSGAPLDELQVEYRRKLSATSSATFKVRPQMHLLMSLYVDCYVHH